MKPNHLRLASLAGLLALLSACGGGSSTGGSGIPAGDGTFRVAPVIQLQAGTVPTEMVSGDFNQDGYGDFAVGTADGRLLVYTGQGDGTFLSGVNVSWAGIGGVSDVEVGDFDGDAYPDMAVVLDGWGGPFVIRNAGGTLPVLQLIQSVTGALGLSGVALADLDLDGDLDMYVASPDLGIVTTFEGDGVGGFALPSAPYAAPVGTSSGRLATGDFDGDGYPDVAVIVPDNNELRVLRGTGTPVLVEAPASPVALSDGPRRIATGDFDGDGWTDLAITAFLAGKVNVLLGFGSAAFVEPLTSPLGVGDEPVGIAVGSVDRDGLPDLAVADKAGMRGLARSQGGGAFAFANTDVAVSDEPSEVVLLDINADGVLDIVTADRLDSTIWVLLGNRELVRPN